MGKLLLAMVLRTESIKYSGHPSKVSSAKLAPPVLTERQIERPAVLERFEASSVRLIVIRAAAGFGKTTFMAQAEARLRLQGYPTAWLTLDAADNDVARFVSSARAALAAGLGAALGAEPLDLIEWIGSRSEPLTFFLDDFEVLRESGVLTLVRSMLEAMPRGCRLAIGSRVEPDLPLARLRAHGDLLEIDTDALRFDLAETGQLASLFSGAVLGTSAVARLHEFSEGWVTALVLAGPALATSGEAFVPHASSSHRALADYLADDVLARQPEEVRDFLLKSSILRYLELPLCQALFPRRDVGRILEHLERQNLFVVAVPGESATWRYHRLFADFLRTRLEQRQPGEAVRLHLLAAAWYESQERFVPAVEHAIAAADYPLALSLLEPNAHWLLERGRMRLLQLWFEQIPANVLETRPQLQAVQAWATLFTRGAVEALALVERTRLTQSVDPAVRAHVNAQQPLFLTMRDRYAEAMAAGAEALRQLPTCSSFADNALRNAMAHVYTIMGEVGLAQRLIDEARQQTGDGAFHQMYAESLQGLLDYRDGRLRLATAHFRAAVNADRSTSHQHSVGNAWAGLLYAGSLYEANDFEAAERLVDVYLPIICEAGVPGHLNLGYRIRTRIAFSRGDVDRAYEALTDLEAFAHQRQLPRIVCNARLERARLLLLQGDAEASRAELDRAEDPEVLRRLEREQLPSNETDYYPLARARWAIHFGEPASVLGLLETWLAEATEQRRHRRALRLRVLHSLALQRSGNPAGAVKVMADTVRDAAQEGFVRIIADEGAEVGRIVQRLHAMYQQMPASRADRFMLDFIGQLLTAFGSLPPERDSPGPVHSVMEALTRKEVQVLQLVADGCSNADLSVKLGASDSTVRTHLRNISSKLGAKSRSEAVVIGRRLGIVR